MMWALPRVVGKLTAPLRRRVQLMVRRAVVALVDDSLKLQSVQVAALAGETLDGVERFQQYGLTAHPHPGAEALVLALGGNTSHSIVIAVDDRRYRLKNLARGEVALYTDEGDIIHIQRGGTIQVTAATQVNITAPNVAMSGDLDVSGNVTVGGNNTVTGNVAASGGVTGATVADASGSMGGIRTSYNGHSHPGGVVVPQM